MTFSSVSNAKIDNLPVLATQAAKAGHLLFFTGPSGVGKNYAADLVMRSPRAWLYLDSIGQIIKEKWIAPVGEVAKAAPNVKSVVGWTDNLEAVAKTVAGAKPSISDVTVFMFLPSPDTFRKIQAAKAVDYDGTNESWRANWLAKSRFTDRQVEEFLRKKNALALSLLTRGFGERIKVHPILVENDAKSPISHGWHKQKWAILDDGSTTKS